MKTEHIHSSNQYWMVVWSRKSGEFMNANTNSHLNEAIEEISSRFETKHPNYKVIHIGEGKIPPKTYRSLEYIN